MHLPVARVCRIVRPWHSLRHTRRSIEEMLFACLFSFVHRARTCRVNRCQDSNPQAGAPQDRSRPEASGTKAKHSVGQASACPLRSSTAMWCESQDRKDRGVATAHRRHFHHRLQAGPVPLKNNWCFSALAQRARVRVYYSGDGIRSLHWAGCNALPHRRAGGRRRDGRGVSR